MEERIDMLRESLERGEDEEVCGCECGHCGSGEILRGKGHTRYDCVGECQERERERRRVDRDLE